MQTVVPKMIYSISNIRKNINFEEASFAHICAVNTHVIVALKLYLKIYIFSLLKPRINKQINHSTDKCDIEK